MYLLLLGLVLLGLKYLDVGPLAGWSWWWVLSPFALAVVWWWWADRSGYTKRQEAKKMDERKARRLDEGRKRLGLPPLDKRR
ncbi:MAG: hypothetical protein RLZZ555_794 [Pseudomonadota bacterium]|jgi:small Trp-rich protein